MYWKFTQVDGQRLIKLHLQKHRFIFLEIPKNRLEHVIINTKTKQNKIYLFWNVLRIRDKIQ